MQFSVCSWKNFQKDGVMKFLFYCALFFTVIVRGMEPENKVISALALHTAAAQGDIVAVQRLLDSGAEVNAVNEYGQTPLHLAAKKGDEGVMRLLLGIPGIEVNFPDEEGRTFLYLAAENGNEKMIKVLLKVSGIDVNASNKEGNSPLGIAVEKGHEEVVRLLLKAPDIKINAANKYGETPLHRAAEKGHVEVVKLLLRAPAIAVNVPTKEGMKPEHWFLDVNGIAPLHCAVENGHVEVVKLLLAAPGIEVNLPTKKGSTPLHRAVAKDQVEVMKLLLAASGIEVNARDEDGRTPLHSAGGTNAVAKTLLATSGINVNAQDKKGWTPLHYAAYNDNDVIETLLGVAEIDVNSADVEGLTSLHCAAQSGRKTAVKMLTDAPKININALDKNERTPLHKAAEHGHEAVVKILLSAPGITINTVDKEGWTPLHWASRKGFAPVVKALLFASGIDFNAKTRNGMTALHLAAVLFGHKEVTKALLAVPEISFNIPDENGMTPLHLAVQNGHRGVVKTLLKAPGISVNSITKAGLTPLDTALQKKINILIVQYLLLHGGKCKFYEKKAIFQNLFGGTAVVNLNDRALQVLQKIFGNYPLVFASILNNTFELQKMISKRQGKKEINQALCYAIGQGHLESVECLVDALEEITQEIFVHLRVVLRNELTQEQKKIYEQIGSLLNQSAKKRELCTICQAQLGSKKQIILACCHAFHKECIEPWLKMKNECPGCRCSVEEIDIKAIDYRLFIAIGQDKFSDIEALLLQGAHPFAEHGGMTAFTFAALLGRADVVRMMLEYAEINPIKDLQECLSAVIQEILKSDEKKYYDVLGALLEAGAIVDPTNGSHVKVIDRMFAGNPFALGAVWGNIPEMGALINAQSNSMMVKSALRYAIGQGHAIIVNIILQQFRNFERKFIEELLEHAKVLFERCLIPEYKNRYNEIIRIMHVEKEKQIVHFSVSSLPSLRDL